MRPTGPESENEEAEGINIKKLGTLHIAVDRWLCFLTAFLRLRLGIPSSNIE